MYSILIRDIFGNESAILIQNTFPTLEKYIDHVHILDNGKPAKVISSTCDEFLENFRQMLKLKNKGLNSFFTDIDKIKKANGR